MGTGEVLLRDANPTYEDGVAYARYVDMASEGGIRRVLGRRYEEIIATAFTSPGHDLSWEHTVFAEMDGEVVGMASAFSAEQHSRASKPPLWDAPGSRLYRALSLAIMGLFLSMMGNHADGDFYLEFLGVDDNLRGKGVGSLLLEFMEQRARAGGSNRFTLDVSAKNDGAERLYARRGMDVVPVGKRGRLRSLFVHRMAKDL